VARLWDGFFDLFRRALDWLIRRVYSPLLGQALSWRYLTVAIALVTLMATAGLVWAGKVKFVFMEMDESNEVAISLTMPLETSAEITGEMIARIERTVLDFRQELERERGEKLFRHVLSSVGEGIQGGMGPGGGPASSAMYLGGVHIELVPSEERTMSAEEVAARLREVVEPVPGAVELTIKSAGLAGGEGMDIQLVGPDFDDLRVAAAELKKELANYQGVTNIADSFRGGKPEIKLDITSKAEALGLSLQDLGMQVRQGFYGEQAQRIQRDRDDVRVMVRYPAEERNTIADLENMRIRTPNGGEVPFLTVARAEMGRGYASIRRVDRQRAINVTADIDPTLANANEVLGALEVEFLPALIEKYPNVRYSLEGQHEDQQDFLDGMLNGSVYVLLIIYAMLAIPFRSYFQPLLVMSAVPFGIVGAIWGHAIMGYNMTALSLMGVIAVAGIVVNDSLVLVSFVNENCKSGKPMLQVVRESGMMRFRAILLTSLTTTAGIAPLMVEQSVQARFLIPMAVSIAFGVLFSTVITLVLVPSSYLILEDVLGFWRWLWGSGRDHRVEAVSVDGELVEVRVKEQEQVGA
jgi:multidrug efflux pump subunit AcrB